MQTVFVILLLGAILAHQSIGVSGFNWRPCPFKQHITCTNITLTPNPPVRGSNTTIVAQCDTDMVLKSDFVFGGNIQVNQTGLWGINLPLAQLIPLPFNPGPVTFAYNLSIPSNAPVGNYFATIAIQTQWTSYGCILFYITF
jgi:ML domain